MSEVLTKNEVFINFLESYKVNNDLEKIFIEFLLDDKENTYLLSNDIYRNGLSGGLWLIYNKDAEKLIKDNLFVFFDYLQNLVNDGNIDIKNLDLSNFFNLYCIVFEFINYSIHESFDSLVRYY
jgi:hypothetical protein